MFASVPAFHGDAVCIAWRFIYLFIFCFFNYFGILGRDGVLRPFEGGRAPRKDGGSGSAYSIDVNPMWICIGGEIENTLDLLIGVVMKCGNAVT